MQEFLRVRVAVDSLIDEIKESIKEKSLSESLERLEQARGLIQELKQLSTTEQAAFVLKRETTITSLMDIAGKLKPPVKKRIPKTAATPVALGADLSF